MTFIHDAPSDKPLTYLYAFVAVDEKGNEGICAFNIPSVGWTPLITGDEKNLPTLEKAAQHLKGLTEKRIKLLKFTTREDMREITNG